MSRKIAAARGMALAAIMLLGVVSVAPIALTQQAGDGVADEQITERDIEQRSKFDYLATHKSPSRQDVIDELREERGKIRDARKAGIDVADAEVDAAYAMIGARMHMTAEQLKEQFARAGIDAATLKQRIRADLAARRMLGRRPQPAQSPGPRE